MKRRTGIWVGFIGCAAALVVGCTSGRITTPSGLAYIDEKQGIGPAVKNGDTVVVDYTAVLEDGTKIDSSKDRREPFIFKQGTAAVVRGFDEGVVGMKVGGKRKLIVPPELAYGKRGYDKVPPEAVLIFDIELLDIK